MDAERERVVETGGTVGWRDLWESCFLRRCRLLAPVISMPSLIETLALMADPTRLRVLLLLQTEELSVVELQEILGMGKSRISNHLAQLRQSGLVKDRRAGKNSYYALGDSAALRDLAPVLAAAMREIPEAAKDAVALKVAIKKRADRAREYFNKLAATIPAVSVRRRVFPNVTA